MTLEAGTPVAPATEATPNTVTPTPATEATPPAPADGAKPKNRAERRAETMRQAIEANQAKAKNNAPAPVVTPPETPAPTDAPPPAAAAPAPLADTPPKPNADNDVALARAIEASLRDQRAAYEARQAAKQHEQKLKELEKQLAERDEAQKKLQADPFKRRIMEGATYEQATQEMVEGKLKPPTAEELERESFKAEQQRIREEWEAEKAQRQKEREEYEAQVTAQREEAELAQRATKLSAKLQEHAATFPTLAAVPWGAAEVLRRHKADPTKSIDDIARDLEQRASTDVGHVFKHGPSARALITDEVMDSWLDDAAFRDRVAKRLAAKQPTPPASPASNPQGETRAGNVPDAIPSSRANDPGDRAKPAKARTSADRAARGLAAVEARRRAARG